MRLEREPFPHGMSLLFFQADPRLAMGFLRRWVGQDELPPWFQWIGPLMILTAGWVRVALFSNQSSWQDPEVAIWGATALCFLVVNTPHAAMTRRRWKAQQPIAPTTFIGDSRLMDLGAHDRSLPFEQERMRKRAVCVSEPIVCVSVAVATAPISLAYSLWVLWNGLLLFHDSAWTVYWARRKRIAMMNAIAQRVLAQRLVESLDEGVRR